MIVFRRLTMGTSVLNSEIVAIHVVAMFYLILFSIEWWCWLYKVLWSEREGMHVEESQPTVYIHRRFRSTADMMVAMIMVISKYNLNKICCLDGKVRWQNQKDNGNWHSVWLGLACCLFFCHSGIVLYWINWCADEMTEWSFVNSPMPVCLWISNWIAIIM